MVCSQGGNQIVVSSRSYPLSLTIYITLSKPKLTYE